MSEFNCLLGDCPDTCCKGWSMQLNDEIFNKHYKGTENEDAVAYDGQNNEIRVMKRDPETDFCVKFTDGICSIHATKGEDYLGDACNFYPRVTRQIGEEKIMTGTLSCPEIARLMIFENDNEGYVSRETSRFPEALRDYGINELSTDNTLKAHQAFLDACKTDDLPKTILSRIYSASQSLEMLDKTGWHEAAPFMIKMADSKIPPAQNDRADNYKILQIFAGIIHATGKKKRERLLETIAFMQKACGVEVDWQTLVLNPTDPSALDHHVEKWRKNSNQFEDVMRKFLAAQISFTTFPFAGLGETLTDKTKMIIFRFALTRLALMGLGEFNEEKIALIIQSISRVMDHIADPVLTLKLMEDSGWVTDGKIHGLIEG